MLISLLLKLKCMMYLLYYQVHQLSLRITVLYNTDNIKTATTDVLTPTITATTVVAAFTLTTYIADAITIATAPTNYHWAFESTNDGTYSNVDQGSRSHIIFNFATKTGKNNKGDETFT